MKSSPSSTSNAGADSASGRMLSPWDLDVRFLKGVGDKVAQLLAKADIRTLWDLVLFLPRTYEDRRRLYGATEILQAADQNQSVLASAVIERWEQKSAGPRGRRWAEAVARIAEPGEAVPSNVLMGTRVAFTFFHDQGFAKRFPEGTTVLFRGKVQDFRGRLQVVHPELQAADAALPPWEFGGWIPVYREVAGIPTRALRRILSLALERPELQRIPESLPPELVARLKMPTLAESLRELHFPRHWQPQGESPKPSGEFLQRIAFEELFMMALALHLRRSQWATQVEDRTREGSGRVLPQFDRNAARFEARLKSLPFELTNGQRRALEDVFDDFEYRKVHAPMHRLIQGDVGSGKTIVAFLAALEIMDEGYQAALMAPTEILADQHYQTFCRLFPERAHEALLLKGALKAKEKIAVRDALTDGRARFVVGTQALLTDDTLFDRLGLVVVDEQHRFGVQQRLSLKKKDAEDLSPHLMVMTATPIPRSLALTIYGDLNLSVIRDKPAGRQAIETYVVKRKQEEALAKRFRLFLDEGRQIYMVYPLVEESEEMDLKDVQNAHKEWCVRFGRSKVGLLHGRMKSSEKEAVMTAFKQGELRVLVSTTVIEVGVDVPNASVIMIEHAERFGLSQLHQLRGRVGRGSTKSYCVLVGPDRPGPQVEERLRILEQSDDGFLIAEKDLEIRGPGEFLGRRQSGLPGFRVAHVLRDIALLETAREEAREILEVDPKLQRPGNSKIRLMLQKWWAGRMELTLSG
jgi:ATP-dependent DNA helicase RecG